MTVGEMLARMTSTEVTEWMAYERIAGPLGPARADVQAAIVAATVANANRGKKGRRFHLRDFIPKWDRRARQSWQQQLAVVEQLNAAFGGADLRKGVDDGDPVPAPGAPRRRRIWRRPGRRPGDR
ncbi:DUF4035 domain-containing protein [Spirillospora sp. NBC_00431]